ncbi:MAG: ribosome silencing factor, partial [Clostridia bacterium]|nr:ribosome silencing factor [Clostridia bacterium]
MTDRSELFENPPVPSMKDAEPLVLAREAAKILLNKKASQLKLLSVSDVTVIADYYVIVTGRSSTQIKALSDDLVYEMGRREVPCAHVEGRDGGAWILCDFG